MKNFVNKQLISVQLCPILSDAMKSPVILLCPMWDMNRPLVQRLHAVHAPPLTHLAAISVIRLMSWYHRACVQVTVILPNNGPKDESADTGDSDVLERSHIVFPLSEKLNVLT